MDVSRLFVESQEDDGPDQGEIISHEIQIIRLKEAAERYARPACPFAIGDVVMPVSDSPYSGVLRPHIIVALRPDAPYNFEVAEPGNSAYGSRHDMRVIAIMPAGFIASHWVESADFVPYEPQKPEA